jgi:hypothetical protein
MPKARKRLQVWIDGERCEGRSTDVFIAALERLGLERIELLPIRVSGLPIVVSVRPERADLYTEHWGKYVRTCTSGAEKHSLLARIATHLPEHRIEVTLTDPTEELLGYTPDANERSVRLVLTSVHDPEETSAVSERCNAAIARALRARSSEILILSIVDERLE